MIPKGPPHYWQDAKDYLRRIDPVLANIIDQYEDPPLTSRGDLLYTLSYSIVGQQISAKAAAAIWARLIQLISPLNTQNILDTPLEQLRDIGLSKRKCEYLKNIAQFVAESTDINWIELTEKEIYQKLIQIKGVGPWTIHMVQIFTLCLPDVLPLQDIAVIRAIEKNYRNAERLTLDEVEAIAAPWRPYRTVAIWYLWRTIDSEPVEY